MVNRGALLLRYKEPAVRWINEADPYPTGRIITIEEVNAERTVYLISDTAGDDDRSLERWLKKIFAMLLESELEGWYTDPTLWPQERSYKLFRQWFTPECHTLLFDVVGGMIYDDEA